MGSFSIWHWLILIILILPNLFSFQQSRRPVSRDGGWRFRWSRSSGLSCFGCSRMPNGRRVLTGDARIVADEKDSRVGWARFCAHAGTNPRANNRGLCKSFLREPLNKWFLVISTAGRNLYVAEFSIPFACKISRFADGIEARAARHGWRGSGFARNDNLFRGSLTRQRECRRVSARTQK